MRRMHTLVAGLTLAMLVVAAAVPVARAETPDVISIGGRACEPIPLASGVPPAPIGTAPCRGVRPGAYVESRVGGCTLNFLFHAYRPNGSFAGRYIGTAGHCILERDGEKKWRRGAGPVARNAGGNRVGEFAYAIFQANKDFALIRIDRNQPAAARVCYWGGPTGTNKTRPAAPRTLHVFGQGLVVGATVPARTLVAPGMPDRDHVNAVGVAVPGDSGGPVVSADRRAVGVLVAVGVGYSGPSDFGDVAITRIVPQLRAAEQILGLDLRLRTAAAASVIPG